ncbi:MAG: Type II secretory pathway, ATPase PulE/Tfp pilus assembly pathway, ATPase PilB [uncultured Sulfurovum sp.]|uniref:Type II secretory pathway, ATPase PulE/Tfp pilus assembly pathway, ATPase PilB n=1 Tax=uncultured Sulfurovum sp. TaxID=269237 RepID=A0A6S6U180_9BACT|nr:MAG: Type II secretory pathway, ATPase PulE/Tfp pilus assembly pathway, ATPase PilB [uncultured Sulfurovum sp.]
MVNLIETMLKEKLITKEAISALVKSRPPKKISFANLVREKMIDLKTVERFLVKKIKQKTITLVDLERIDGIDIVPIMTEIAHDMGVEYIDLDEIEIDMKLFSKVPHKQLMKYNVIPVEENEFHVLVVFDDPDDMSAQDAVQRLFPRKPINVAIAIPKQIKKHLQRLEISESIEGLITEIRDDLSQESIKENTEDSPAVLKLIDILLKSSIYAGASDIHVEATEKACVIRERTDGMLRQSFTFDKDIFNPLASKLKLLSNLDIAEKRKPQDGRFSARVSKKDFDFRVSTLPTIYGESIVMRILDKTKAMIKLEEAGMSRICYEKFSKAIKVPYGIVLVTGPTGSGKTTTLYGALNAIKDVKDKIITVEDPVEYQMSGLQQVQVRPNVGLDFAAALKSILRQDPDKIMIGEIRDQETLRIAIQAALTGHLVLSTLHTNDAISAVTRILDMGIEEYLVSGALVAIQAQRLVRKICTHCKIELDVDDSLLNDIREYLPSNPVFYEGKGCRECGNSGYSGREMISEVLVISETLSRMIAKNASKEEMTRQAKEEHFVSMFEDGISKALEGKTTLEEIYRVARL